MKKLLLILLFIPLVSIGQEEVIVIVELIKNENKSSQLFNVTVWSKVTSKSF